jgi:transposase-like protein
MSDSQGDFKEFNPVPDLPCHKCGEKEVKARKWESSCGGWEDYQFKCSSCGYTWWVDGIDS